MKVQEISSFVMFLKSKHRTLLFCRLVFIHSGALNLLRNSTGNVVSLCKVFEKGTLFGIELSGHDRHVQMHLPKRERQMCFSFGPDTTSFVLIGRGCPDQGGWWTRAMHDPLWKRVSAPHFEVPVRFIKLGCI